MTVYSYLDLSTAHLTEGEMDAVAHNLPDRDDTGPRIIRHEYGAWVNVPSGWDDAEKAELARLYPNLAACIEHARSLGCLWINFDQDGDTIADLPAFEW